MEHQLVIPFPDQSPSFAHGVAWELFRQRLIAQRAPFAEFVVEVWAQSFVDLCQHYHRESKVSSCDWPGYVYFKIGPAPKTD